MSSNSVLPLTVPITAEIAPQMVNFAPVRKAFVLHNAKPKPRETMFASRMMTVPAAHVVDKLHSDRDADGDPIPGTYVVEDDYQWSPYTRSLVQIFDSERAVIHILGIKQRPDGTASELTSQHAISGLSLLPRNSPKSLWKAVAAAGDHRAFLSMVENARYTIGAIDSANAIRRGDGRPPLSGSPEEQHAMKLIAEYDRLARVQVDEQLAPHREEAEAREAAEQLEFLVFMKATVQGIVEKAAEGRKLDKAAAFDEAMKDPEIRKYAQKAWRFRKKGYSPIEDKELDAAAEEGRDLDDVK